MLMDIWMDHNASFSTKLWIIFNPLMLLFDYWYILTSYCPDCFSCKGPSGDKHWCSIKFYVFKEQPWILYRNIAAAEEPPQLVAAKEINKVFEVFNFDFGILKYFEVWPLSSSDPLNFCVNRDDNGLGIFGLKNYRNKGWPKGLLLDCIVVDTYDPQTI